MSKSKSKKTKPGLGKGLGALLPSIEFSDKGFKFKPEDEEVKEGTIASIDISKIKPNPFQPRKHFDPKKLDDLMNSIIEHGVIQPVTVRRVSTGYELLSGERRLRASQMAGFDNIPAYIMEIESDTTMLEMALIENLQRDDLNPIEIAQGYQRLIDECNLTQEQLAKSVSKDRSTITNFLRLIKLPENIQESLRQKEMSMGHARALLPISDEKQLELAWREVVDNHLSVRFTEQMAKDVESGALILSEDSKSDIKQRIKKSATKKEKSFITPEENIILNNRISQLQHAFGTKVSISMKSESTGKFDFEFYSKDDFERLFDLFSSVSSG